MSCRVIPGSFLRNRIALMRDARFAWLMTLLLASVLTGCGSKSTSPRITGGPIPTLVLAPVVSGLTTPVDLQFPNDATNRMFVVQQPGSIRMVANGSLAPTAFLDLTAKVNSGGEMGLLGLAFHPQFTQNHLFYVHYDRPSAARSKAWYPNFTFPLPMPIRPTPQASESC